MMDETVDKIKICVSNGVATVWNAHDVRILREKHRIIGTFIGCLPRAPLQNNLLGLPLQLLPEEATLLKEKGLACLIEYDRLEAHATDEESKQFQKLRHLSIEGQIELCLERRKRQIEAMCNSKQNGKNKKHKSAQKQVPSEEQQQRDNDSGIETITSIAEDRDKTLDNALQRVEPVPKSACLVQITTECPWLQNGRDAVWPFPCSDSEKLRYHAFIDLWERGFYLTSGKKFGGDFLVYKGDPHQCHADFIMVCVNFSDNIHSLEFITKGRLGTSVNKKVMFCSLVDSKMVYTSMQWKSKRLKD